LLVLLFPFRLLHGYAGKRTGKHGKKKINQAALGKERTEHEPRVGGVEGWQRGIYGRLGGLPGVRGCLVGGVDDICISSRFRSVLWRGNCAPV